MKIVSKYLFLICFIIIISGCVGVQKKASTDEINKMQKIVVITLEPPPLYIPGVDANDWSPDWANQLRTSQSLTMIPGNITQIAGVAGMLGSGIVAVIKSYEPPPDVDIELASMDLQELKESIADPWIPTVFLAQEIKRQLSLTNTYEITVPPKIYEISGVSFKGATLTMENWLQPIRRWYNSNTGLFDYRNFHAEGINGIIEVGLSNYEIELFKIYLLIQVKMRLVDANTGMVLGRARDHAIVKIGDFKTLFSDDGEHFKELFYNATPELVTQNLKDIGFLDNQ
jgi:hypothetical protein